MLSEKFFLLLIPVTGLLLYAKTMLFGFTFADDAQLIVANSDFLRDLRNIPRLFTQDVFVTVANPTLFYRPLLNLLFMLETQVAGTSPWLYHATNIVLHISCALLLMKVLESFTESAVAAGLLALLFTVHPLLTSAVTWIPGRNDSLMTLLALASTISLQRFVDRKDMTSYLLHLLLLFLALLTKESAVVLPLLFAGYWWMAPNTRRDFRSMLPLLGGWFLVAGVWLLMRQSVPRTYNVNIPFLEVLSHLATNAAAFLFYVGKALFPFNLSVFPNLADAALGWGVAAALLVALALVVARSRRIAFWALGWFILFLVPSLTFGEIWHEHRAYCPLVGLMILAAQLPFWKRLNLRMPRNLAGAVAVIALFGGIAFSHAENFRDRRNFSSNVYQHSPSLDVAYTMMGGLLIDENRYDEAETVLRKGVQRNPEIKIGHRMLGDIYTRKGEFDSAAAEYEMALQLEPLSLTAYASYGKLCVKVGRIDQAQQLWTRAIEIQPDFFLGYYLLANFYLHELNDPDSAMVYARALERRGVEVMPELLSQIRNHPRFHAAD